MPSKRLNQHQAIEEHDVLERYQVWAKRKFLTLTRWPNARDIKCYKERFMKVDKITTVSEKKYVGRINKRRLLLDLTFLLGLLLVLGVSGQRRFGLAQMFSFKATAPSVATEAALPSVTASGESGRAPAQPARSAQRVTGWELITVRPKGFEPSSITRAAGPFILKVDNRSGLREVSLRLDRVAGTRLRAVQVPRQKLDWREQLELGPGNYLLTEANNPTWVCRITVTAQ
jgi:hypothetical protein